MSAQPLPQQEMLAQLLQNNGSKKQQLLTQLLLQQQQQDNVPSPPANDKVRGQLKRLSQQNQQLKKRLARAKSERRELLEYLDFLLELNQRFAAATGACECWGEDPDCDHCRGKGTAGWRPPQPEEFRAFIQPTLQHESAPATVTAEGEPS